MTDQSTSPARVDRTPKVRRMSALRGLIGPFVALGLVVLLFGIADRMREGGGGFLTLRNAQALSVQTATVAVAALGMTVIIVAGGIDLSAGTSLSLCACVLAWSLKTDIGERFFPRGPTSVVNEANDSPATSSDEVTAGSTTANPLTPPMAIALCLLTGCACGFVNGSLISALRVVPFIVTLGTMTLFLGVAKWLADNTTIRPEKATQVPAWLANLTSIRSESLWLGFPTGLWLALVLAALLSVVLHYTVFSRYVFALGSNELTARLCGINVPSTKIAVYALAGLFIGIAGIYQFSRLSVGNPTSGVGLELNIIAAVVIGGGSLSGGRGSVLGTLTGAAIMAVITSGCTQLGLSNASQDMILGIIIIAAVTLDQYRQRRLADA